jgi:hypothetical protein
MTSRTRRIGDYFSRKWTKIKPKSVQDWFGVILLAAITLALFSFVQPAKIFTDTTTNGGDTGAHVFAPAYLRDTLLRDFRLTGWSQDWYGGFPVYQFYMVVPALMILALDVIMPYNVAFKLITISGVVLQPLAVYLMARRIRLPFPLPPLMAVMSTYFVLDPNFKIYGGNLVSTLAGEFSFSISLVFALLYLGTLMRGFETGGHRRKAALYLGLAALTHVIPALFALGATLVVVLVWSLSVFPRTLRYIWLTTLIVSLTSWGVAAAQNLSMSTLFLAAGLTFVTALTLTVVWLLTYSGRMRMWWLVTAGGTGFLLSLFWILPFFANRGELNDMGWQKLTNTIDPLFQPHEINDGTRFIGYFLVLAAIGFVGSVIRWSKPGVVFGLTTVLFGSLYATTPQTRLWNARLLPFWYLGIYFLAAFGVYELIQAAAWAVRRIKVPSTLVRQQTLHRKVVLIGASVALFIFTMQFLQTNRYWYGGDIEATEDGSALYGVGPIRTKEYNYGRSWARWNYRGYQEQAAYPQYYDVVTTMETLGQEYGCGRALWEYNKEELGSYGTPMALMLLPYWTDSCIGSMEGLFFETTLSVPFHFLMQAELSESPSRPMRDIPYSGMDFELGVRHMQMFGVKYYMSVTPAATAEALLQPDLVVRATSGDWTIFEVMNSGIVEPLTVQPVVGEFLGENGREWIDPSVAWFMDRQRWNTPLALDGPDEWQRVQDQTDVVPATALPEVEVTNLVNDQDTITFSVDQIGVPVVVKTSYHPNWSADGADGPYRLAPNMMVVIPTQENVTVSYGYGTADYVGWAGTFAGIGMLLFGLRATVQFESEKPRKTAELLETS